MSGTVSVTIVWHNLWNKSITLKHFWQNCITNRPSFVQVDLPAEQKANQFPAIPGTRQNLPGRPYSFVTFRAKKRVLMQDGYKLNRRAGAKISRKNPGIPAAGAERIPGMRSLGVYSARRALTGLHLAAPRAGMMPARMVSRVASATRKRAASTGREATRVEVPETF